MEKKLKESVVNQNQYDVGSIILFMDNGEVREGTITGLTAIYDNADKQSKVVYEVENQWGSFLVHEKDIIGG